MKDHEISFHIARLLSPIQRLCINSVEYHWRNPSRYKRYLAELIYQIAYEEGLYNNLYKYDDLVLWLLKSENWSQKEEDRLEGLKKDLEELKVQLFKSEFNDSQQKTIKFALGKCRKEIGELLEKKHRFDYLTCEYVAEQAKERFLIGCGLYIGKKIYWTEPLKNWRENDDLVDAAQIRLNDNKLDEAQLREIAKTPYWRNLQVKANPDSINELRDLVGWSQMYNSIQKHPECPDEECIEDDDRLDGWLILQSRERKHNKIQREAQSLAAKHGNKGEIYVMTDKKNAKKIYDMNSIGAKQVINERSKALAQSGILDESQLPDRQREISQKITQAERAKYG